MSNELDRMLVGADALDGLVREHMAWITECLSDGKHDGWRPTVAALVKDNPADQGGIFMHSILAAFDEDDEKHAVMRMIGRKIYEAHKFPVAAVISSEAWLSKQRGGQKAPHCEPRHDPAREEVILIMGLTLGNKHAALTSAPIESCLRDKRRNIKIGAFTAIHTKEVGVPILEQLFLGFFEGPAQKAGIKLPES